MEGKSPAADVAASRLAQLLDRLGYPREEAPEAAASDATPGGASNAGTPATATLHDLIPATRVLSETPGLEDADQDQDEEIDA